MNIENYAFQTNAKEFLKDIPQRIKSSSTLVKFKENNTIFKKSDTTEYGYILLSGELLVINEFVEGNYYAFSTLKPFTFLSDLECLSEEMKNAATVIASKESALLRFPIEDFVYCLKNDYNFLSSVATSLSKKIYFTSYERGKNLYKTGITKVISYIVTYCQIDEIDSKNRIFINRTREMIASEIGVSVKTVNRSVSELADKGVIELIKGKINVSSKQYNDLLELINIK